VSWRSRHFPRFENSRCSAMGWVRYLPQGLITSKPHF
jgi:hypothetical protein